MRNKRACSTTFMRYISGCRLCMCNIHINGVVHGCCSSSSSLFFSVVVWFYIVSVSESLCVCRVSTICGVQLKVKSNRRGGGFIHIIVHAAAGCCCCCTAPSAPKRIMRVFNEFIYTRHMWCFPAGLSSHTHTQTLNFHIFRIECNMRNNWCNWSAYRTPASTDGVRACSPYMYNKHIRFAQMESDPQCCLRATTYAYVDHICYMHEKQYPHHQDDDQHTRMYFSCSSNQQKKISSH